MGRTIISIGLFGAIFATMLFVMIQIFSGLRPKKATHLVTAPKQVKNKPTSELTDFFYNTIDLGSSRTPPPSSETSSHLDDLGLKPESKSVAYSVTVGNFRKFSEVRKIVKQLSEHGFVVHTEKKDSGTQTHYIVKVGFYATSSEAELAADKLTTSGLIRTALAPVEKEYF